MHRNRLFYFGPVLISLVLILSLFSGCVNLDPFSSGSLNETASESFSQVIPIENQTQLTIENVNGTVEVIGSDDSLNVTISVEKRVRADSQTEAQAHLDDIIIQTESDLDHVTVHTEQPNSNQRTYSVYYEITVPKSWKVTAVNTNGEVSLSQIQNDIWIAQTNGNILFVDIIGNINAYLTNGNVFGRAELPSQGTIQLSATNGEITLEIPQETSSQFSARTTNGQVTISNLQLQNSIISKKSITGMLGNGDGNIELVLTNGEIGVVGY